MGSLVPFSITTNCTMKSLLIFATVLAVGLAEEAKAVVAPAPYLYGYPGYGAAPLAYNYAPVAYNNAPYTYATAPVVAAAPAPIAQTYAPAFAPVPAPAVSSQFAAQDEFKNTHYGYSNLNSAKQESGNAFTGWLEVTNTLTLMVFSKLSIMSLMLWDSEWLIPGCLYIILSSLLLPFMMPNSLLLPFTMVLLPNLSKTLLRWPPLRPNSPPHLKKLPAGKSVNLTPL